MIFKRVVYGSILAFAVAAIWLQLTYKKSPPLPVYKAVPDFHLVDSRGGTVTLAELKGKVWVADFFYASCPGPCPMISSRLSSLQDEALKDDRVRFVSVSTDPEMDTPEVLNTYASKFHASGKWLFLTGDRQQIYSLANKGFLLTAVVQNDVKNPVVHSTKLALVDKAGNIRGYYDGTDDATNVRILYDIKRLLHE